MTQDEIVRRFRAGERIHVEVGPQAMRGFVCMLDSDARAIVRFDSSGVLATVPVAELSYLPGHGCGCNPPGYDEAAQLRAIETELAARSGGGS